MTLIAIALFLLPLLEQQPPVPTHVAVAKQKTSMVVALAVEEAASYTPAWEQALRAELIDSPEYTEELVSAIKAAAKETSIEPSLLWAVMYTESHGRHWHPDGRVKRGGAGEIGLMQIQPFWQRALKKHYGLEVDLYDVTDNVMAGAFILRRGGETAKVMLSYYNTGKQLNSTPYQRKVMRYLEHVEANYSDDLATAQPKQG